MVYFHEIVARLVIVASVVIIVETRARYIYQPGPFLECEQLQIPCGGHSKESCNEYCESNGFTQGTCNGHCCFCIARPRGMLSSLPIFGQLQHSVQRHNRVTSTDNALTLTGPKEIVTPNIPERHDDDHANHELPPVEEIDIDLNQLELSTSKPKRFASIADNEMSSVHSPNHNNYIIDEITRKPRISFNNNLATTEQPSTTPTTNSSQNVMNDTNVCLTPGCVKTAQAILENLDETVSPCDDFYQFVCGNFQKDEPIPDDKGAVTLMGSIDDTLTAKLREMLDEEKLDNKELPHSSRLVKTLYDSCRNSDLLESSGVSPLKNLLKTLGGWPVLEGSNWTSTNWNWETSIANLRKSGLVADYLLKMAVVPDLKHPSRRILNIGEPLLTIKKEQVRNPIFMGAYRKFQVDVAVLLGANKTQAENEMASVFQFELMLANISLPREMSRAHPLNFYHPTTISQLQTVYPSVHWLSYINALLPENTKVDNNQVVNVHLPEQMTVLLNFIESTDKRVLANYLLWRVSSAVLPYLNEAAMQVQQSFTGSITGRIQRKPRWRECVDIASTTLGQAIGAMYVRKHFDETSKGVAVEMVKDIQNAFVDILMKMDWMDEETKRRAFEKLTAMKTNIGYPKEILDEDILKNLYNGLVLSPDNFFGNLLNLTRGAGNFVMGKLHQPVDKNDWVSFGKPAMVNAFYQPITNSIQFPAGILQGKFFDKNRPAYMNYGAIGWVIGHEITHGYDDQGSHFDPNGELRDWWDPKTKHLFHEKAKCLMSQYGKFTYTDSAQNITIPINGVISVGENIADNGGIKQAYNGYQSWVRRNGHEKQLPGLKYNSNQLFWMSAATNWCSKVRPQQMVESIQMGVHSPGQYRVRGTFANIEQFAKDFSCPVGTPMNPKTKCTVW